VQILQARDDAKGGDAFTVVQIDMDNPGVS